MGSPVARPGPGRLLPPAAATCLFPRGALRIAGFRFLWRLKREREAIEGRVTLG
ncbi:hypothetical protein [Streptomyces sp. NPDC052811]|uniref:hypothetical protein n=1 Tax=Streptomyces sp. NPDC052811 TaxID=3155731 RepID=UPI003434F38F